MDSNQQYALTVNDLGSAPLKMSLDEGVEAIGRLEGRVLMHQSQIVILRYMAGRVVHTIMDAEAEGDSDSTYGKGVINEIASRTGINRNILRLSKRLYEHFVGREEEFVQWVNDKRRHWQAVEGLLRADTDPNVLGADAHSERLKRRAERFMRDLDELSTQAEAGDAEAEGILVAAAEEVERFRNSVTARSDSGNMITVRTDDYLDFIRSKPCCLCGKEGPSEAHHVAQGGVGMKGSDMSCIPLCSEHHVLTEDKGHGHVSRAFKVSLTAIICDLLHEHITSQKMGLPKVLMMDSIPF